MRREDCSDWIITDPDCAQCCRRTPELGERVFELTQINSFDGHVDGKPFYQVAHGHLYLEEYSSEEIQDILAFYGYDGVAEFREAYTGVPEESYDQLLAEMFFEAEIQEFCFKEFTRWNDAVTHIETLTGLDLSDCKESEKSTLACLIGKAQDVVSSQRESAMASKEEARSPVPFMGSDNGR